MAYSYEVGLTRLASTPILGRSIQFSECESTIATEAWPQWRPIISSFADGPALALLFFLLLLRFFIHQEHILAM